MLSVFQSVENTRKYCAYLRTAMFHSANHDTDIDEIQGYRFSRWLQLVSNMWRSHLNIGISLHRHNYNNVCNVLSKYLKGSLSYVREPSDERIKNKISCQQKFDTSEI